MHRAVLGERRSAETCLLCSSQRTPRKNELRCETDEEAIERPTPCRRTRGREPTLCEKQLFRLLHLRRIFETIGDGARIPLPVLPEMDSKPRPREVK